MISLILPYWDRQEAANKAFAFLDRHYSHIDLEVVVVDDGNKIPFVVPECQLNVKVVRLPIKDRPTPQSKAWNAGVAAASGEIIALSCVEVLHTNPVLVGLERNLCQIGADGYVLAAAWCPEEGKWHCHSTEKVPTVPEGTGPAFLGMMHKSLLDRIGGFDEIYHDGAGYEDKDFIWKLVKANAQIVIRDDLIVTHPKSGATIKWPVEGFIRNEAIYMNKWHRKPINVVCLKAGDAYSAEYVNILLDMVRRNLAEGWPGEFYCITDDPSGLDAGIKPIPLPDDLETWWGKLYMFKRGLFQDGARCVFFDLDTLIVGNIGWLAQYDGQFATLRDFYCDRLGPAIIAWEAGEFAASIWDEWVAQGKPRHQMGDLWWLNQLDQGRFAREIDILQDKFPGKVCSYKAHCKPYPPAGTTIVCFHGQPKPSNCAEPWVADVWKVGGAGMAQFEVVANTYHQHIRDNILSACNRDLPWMDILPEHAGHAVIVAGGPSLLSTIEEVRARANHGQTVVACNGAAKFLASHGVKVDWHIIIDARQENLKFIADAKSGRQFIASQCHPDLFDAASNPTVIHMNTDGIIDVLPKDKVAHLLSSGTTVGLAAMALCYTQGYRNLHLYGFDSSISENHHAYPQSSNDADPVIEVSVEGMTFKSTPWMVKQVEQFQVLSGQLANAGCVITVAGNGLLPFVAHLMEDKYK